MYYENIFGWTDFQNLYSECVEKYDNCDFFEVGCFQGRSAVYLAETIKEKKKNIKLTCIDMWPDKESLDELQHLGIGQGAEREEICKLSSSLYETFLGHVVNADVNDIVTPMRMSSHEAALILQGQGKKFAMGFIDAAHHYEGVMSDLVDYWPLIESGGTFMGHDYHSSVRLAVDKFFADLNLYVRIDRDSWIVKKP